MRNDSGKLENEHDEFFQHKSLIEERVIELLGEKTLGQEQLVTAFVDFIYSFHQIYDSNSEEKVRLLGNFLMLIASLSQNWYKINRNIFPRIMKSSLFSNIKFSASEIQQARNIVNEYIACQAYGIERIPRDKVDIVLYQLSNHCIEG